MKKQSKEQIITADFNVKGNGTYKVIIVGKNAVRAESETLEVTGLISLSGIISAGSVINGGVLLSVSGESVDDNIKKIEIYEVQSKIGEIPIEEPIKTIEKTYQIDYIPFFEEKNYFAKIISTDKQEILTNTVKISNQNTIKTKEDLTKFASLVSAGNSFYAKTIKLISNIDSIGSFQAIGHGLEEGNGFDGTFDGNYNILSDITINATDTNLGFFTELQSHATIKNLILKDCSISNNYPAKGYDVYIGGFAGKNCGTIENCAYIGSVTYSRRYIYSQKDYDMTDYPYAGSICGWTEGGNVTNCVFIGNVSANGFMPCAGGIIALLSGGGVCQGCYSVGSVSIPYCEKNPRCGGIIGEDWREGYNKLAVSYCINQSKVSSMEEGGYIFTAGISALISYYDARYAPDISSAKNWDILNHEIGYYYRYGNNLYDGESTGCKPPSSSLEEVAKQAGVESAVTTDASRKLNYYAFMVCKNKG